MVYTIFVVHQTDTDMAQDPKKKAIPQVTRSGRIAKEDLDALGGTLPAGKGHWVRKELMALALGEMLFVHRSDWNWKGRGNGPSRIANHINRKTAREYRTMLAANGTGWVIERVK